MHADKLQNDCASPGQRLPAGRGFFIWRGFPATVGLSLPRGRQDLANGVGWFAGPACSYQGISGRVVSGVSLAEFTSRILDGWVGGVALLGRVSPTPPIVDLGLGDCRPIRLPCRRRPIQLA